MKESGTELKWSDYKDSVIFLLPYCLLGFPVPASAGDVRDTGPIPGSGGSPGGGRDNPLQYSGLKNPMDRGAWHAIARGAPKSQAQLNN